MSARTIRAVVGRFVVVGALVIAVVIGSVGVRQSSVAAEGKYTCEQAGALGRMWLAVGNVFLAYDSSGAAAAAFGRATAYFDYC
jgi:hypothetical protein